MIDIEFEEPSYYKCDCCGGTTTKLTRCVYNDEGAHAIYYASYTSDHKTKSVNLYISIGEWGDGTSPEDRKAFVLTMWDRKKEYGVTVLNADESPWHNVTIGGQILDREKALNNPLIEEVFHITDHIAMEDKIVKEYLDRMIV